MVHGTLENLEKMKLKGKEHIIGQMEEFMQAIGKIIKCMAKEYLHGQITEDIRVTTLMTKKKVILILLFFLINKIYLLGFGVFIWPDG